MLQYYVSQEYRTKKGKRYGPYNVLRESRTRGAVYLGKVETPPNLAETVAGKYPHRMPTKEEVEELL